MLNWIKKLLGTKGTASTAQLSARFIEAGGSYIQLVKSRIIEALVTEHVTLLPASSSAEQRFSLLLALCAYFAARTDYELETRRVSEAFRDEVWPHVFEAVFEEMKISNHVASVARPLILGQMGLVRGMIQTKGAGDSDAVAQTLAVLSGSAAKIAGAENDVPLSVNAARVAHLLEAYAGYRSYLDVLAAEVNAHA